MSNPKTISLKVKDAMIEVLEGLPATSDGTEIQAVVGSGADVFASYPVVRVLPAGVNRNTAADTRYDDYTINFAIAVYLDMEQEQTPQEETIDAMIEICDNILERLDGYDWKPVNNALILVANATTSTLDTVATKGGTALMCEILYPVTYRKVI